MIRLKTAKIAICERRGWDEYGAGYYGAPRGGRTHSGVDFLAEPGEILLTPVAGVVTKIGWAYRDDPFYRYVQISCGEDLKHRFFYVEPLRLNIGDHVKAGDPVGVVQDLGRRYRGIPNHVHYEIMAGTKFINPDDYLK